MPLSTAVTAEIHWWFKYLKNTTQSLQDITVDCTIERDATEHGWDATDGYSPTSDRWSSLEGNHFNVLELKAILLALKSYFIHNCNVTHVHILTDNSTALAYINNIGGMRSVLCNNIAKYIWKFAQNRGFWVSSSQAPGVENKMAEKMSRVNKCQ